MGERRAQPITPGTREQILFTVFYLLVKPGMKVSGDEMKGTEMKQKLLAVQTGQKAT